MTRNDCIDECIKIWNDPTIPDEDKTEKITELLLSIEGGFSKSKVRKLLKVLKNKGIPVESTDLWNELR